MYFEQFNQMVKMLGQVGKWLDAAEEYAKAKSFDPSVLLGSRLAPDQLPLIRQVQITCDTAKLGSSRITGKEAPPHPDTETTIADLRSRLAGVSSYLRSFTAKDFEGAATRVVTQPRWEGKTMSGENYFLEHVVPNFYFHASLIYSILRHNGVPLGKKDYLGALTYQ
jgi:uncharacterized protein